MKDLLLYLRVLDATASRARRAEIVRVLYPNTDGRADSMGTLKDDIKAARAILALRDLRALREV